MMMPSWAPRPVPTMIAVGVASPRAHGQAMISTATAAVNADAADSPTPSQKPRVATARAMTIGTNTAEMRSASRCTGALPVCASSTRRAIWASLVSAPTRVARTTSRPPALTVAPMTASPGATSTGTGSPVSSEASIADEPSVMTPSVATFSPAARRTRRRPRAARSGRAPRRPRAGRRRPWHRARAGRAARRPDRRLARASKNRPARMNVVTPAATSRYSMLGAVAAFGPEREPVRHAGHAGVAEEEGVQRPAERGEDTERDEGVHGGGGVAQVGPCRSMERPCTPRHDGRGQRQREPLPVLELQRRDHRQQDDGNGQDRPTSTSRSRSRRASSTPPAGAGAARSAGVGRASRAV